MRGAHHQTLLRDLGWLPVNRVTAAKARTKQPRRTGGRRVEKSTHVEDRTITLPDGTETTISLFALGGAVGIGALTDTGKLNFTELARVRTHRNADKNGYRWYNDYRLPDHLGGGTITVRLHGNADDDSAEVQPHRERPAHPPDRPRLRRALPRDATTPSPSTAPSTTPSGSAEPTASATNASTSTCSPTPSSSTRLRCTATGNAAATRRSPTPPEAASAATPAGRTMTVEAGANGPGRFSPRFAPAPARGVGHRPTTHPPVHRARRPRRRGARAAPARGAPWTRRCAPRRPDPRPPTAPARRAPPVDRSSASPRQRRRTSGPAQRWRRKMTATATSIHPHGGNDDPPPRRRCGDRRHPCPRTQDGTRSRRQAKKSLRSCIRSAAGRELHGEPSLKDAPVRRYLLPVISALADVRRLRWPRGRAGGRRISRRRPRHPRHPRRRLRQRRADPRRLPARHGHRAVVAAGWQLRPGRAGGRRRCLGRPDPAATATGRRAERHVSPT